MAARGLARRGVPPGHEGARARSLQDRRTIALRATALARSRHQRPAQERLVRHEPPRWAQSLVVTASRERSSGCSYDEFGEGCGAAQARRVPIRASSTEWTELVVDDDELVAGRRGEACAARAASGQFD